MTEQNKDQAEPVTNESLLQRINQLEESLKEQQPSILGAIRTFVSDFSSFHAGNRDFPQAAALGVLFAYLRPRIIIVLGSIAAVIFTGMQVWLLLSQNRLIAQQNTMIESQARSNRMQAISAMLVDYEPQTPSPVVLAQLSVYGQEGFDVLRALSREGSVPVLQALAAGAESHTSVQAATVMEILISAYADLLPAFEAEKAREESREFQHPASLLEWRRTREASTQPPRDETQPVLITTSIEIARDLQTIAALASDYLESARDLDFSSFDAYRRGDLVEEMVDIYARGIPRPNGGDSGDVAIHAMDRTLTAVCDRLVGSASLSSLAMQMEEVAARLSEADQSSLKMSEFAHLYIGRRCVARSVAVGFSAADPQTDASKNAQKLIEQDLP